MCPRFGGWVVWRFAGLLARCLAGRLVGWLARWLAGWSTISDAKFLRMSQLRCTILFICVGCLSSRAHFRCRCRFPILHNNQVDGPIPPELGSISKLSLLSLANNGFSETLPPELGNLVGIAVYALYTNKLSGPIPPELGKMKLVLDINLHTVS